LAEYLGFGQMATNMHNDEDDENTDICVFLRVLRLISKSN